MTDAPALPTSPHDAFASVEAAIEAARRWALDPDPRLPNELAVNGSWVRSMDRERPSGYESPSRPNQYETYESEVRNGYEANSFTVGSPYSQGFWRDVRDLGYGTAAWTATVPSGDNPTEGAPMTYATTDQLSNPSAAFRLDQHEQNAALMEPWRKTIIRWVNEVGYEAAGMHSTWATASLDDIHSSLERCIQEPYRMAATLPRFAGWLRDHSQTAPDPTTPATAPDGGTVVPIGPEHPGWQAFWERARRLADDAGYPDYYRTLARSFNVLPARVRQTVRFTVDVDITLDAENTREDDLTYEAAEAARRQLGRGTFREINSQLTRSAPVA